jgi:hypothetical protein
MNSIDKLEEAVARVRKMDEQDEAHGFKTPKEVSRHEILSTAMAAMDAGIEMMKHGRAGQAEDVLYESAVYFLEAGIATKS